MKDKIVLSLGAGVQSSAMAIACDKGVLPYKPEFAIFADTGAEPDAVYVMVESIKKIVSFPVVTVQSTEPMLKTIFDRKLSHMPLFVKKSGGGWGMMRRQCTSRFKIEPIQRYVRKYFKMRLKINRDMKIKMLIGISIDEATRMRVSRDKWVLNTYPLIEGNWNRNDCAKYLNNYNIKPVKSACVFCPYKDNAAWQHLKNTDKKNWERAVKVDHAIRNVRGGKYENYLHRYLKPLDTIEFVDKTPDMFEEDYEGYCGV